MPIYCRGTHCKNCIIFYGHIWKDFDEESKEDLCSITFPIRYKKHQVISMESNPSQNVYVIKKGLVKTYKTLPGGKQQILEILSKRADDINALVEAIQDKSFISPGDVEFEPQPVLDEIEEKVKKVKAGVKKINKLSKEKTKIISDLNKD